MEPRTEIVLALMNVDEPVGLSKLSKISHLSIQHVDYWITKLVDEGIVLCTDVNEQHRYFLQPIFYDTDFAKKFDKVFDDLFEIVEKNLQVLTEPEKKKAAFTAIVDIIRVIQNRSKLL